MKTTLDIPDDIFRKVKARAAMRGISLRQFVTEVLEEKVTPPSSAHGPRSEPPWMQSFGVLSDLKDETREIEAQIAEAFENISEEDRE